jgi:hypothetical protein
VDRIIAIPSLKEVCLVFSTKEMEINTMCEARFLKHGTKSFIYKRLRGSIIFPLLALFICSTVTGFSQILNWATAVRDSGTPIGGESGRVGVGAVNWNGSLWVAYLGTAVIDTAGNSYIYTAYNSGGTTFSNKNQVTVSGGSVVAGISNPALAVFNDRLYLSYIDGNNNAQIISSSDGVNWGSSIGFVMSGVDASPSLAVFGPELYIGLRKHADTSLTLARVSSGLLYPVTATNYPSIQLNFNPGLAVFNNTLYIGIESSANTHAILVYTSGDGLTLSESTAAASDQTSTAPTLAVHNSVLYLGFRSNDSKRNFLYKYTADGTNWSSAIQPHFGIGGNPTLVNTTDLTGPYNGDIFLFYPSQSSPSYLCSSSAQ